MKKGLQIFGITLLVCCAAFPFIGWQGRWNAGEEHNRSLSWEPFLKKSPSLQMRYFNPLDCGDCEEKTVATLDPARQEQFSAICEARYGITDLQACALRLDR